MANEHKMAVYWSKFRKQPLITSQDYMTVLRRVTMLSGLAGEYKEDFIEGKSFPSNISPYHQDLLSRILNILCAFQGDKTHLPLFSSDTVIAPLLTGLFHFELTNSLWGRTFLHHTCQGQGKNQAVSSYFHQLGYETILFQGFGEESLEFDYCPFPAFLQSQDCLFCGKEIDFPNKELEVFSLKMQDIKLKSLYHDHCERDWETIRTLFRMSVFGLQKEEELFQGFNDPSDAQAAILMAYSHLLKFLDRPYRPKYQLVTAYKSISIGWLERVVSGETQCLEALPIFHPEKVEKKLLFLAKPTKVLECQEDWLFLDELADCFKPTP